MNISFILPHYPIKPIGGFRVVYQYANELAKNGHDVSVIHPAFMPNHPIKLSPIKKVKRKIKKVIYPIILPKKPNIEWQSIDKTVKMLYIPFLDEKFIPNGDIVIATAWETADYVYNFKKQKGDKYYFIQHYEDWSGPEERVKQTWLYPLKKIVIASWLKELGEKLGEKNIKVVPNAIEHDKFFITKKIEDRPNRVSMLYHKSKWKGCEDGINALKMVKEKYPELEAVMFGFPERGEEIPSWIKYYRNPSQEVLRDEVYNNSSIFLCPSWSEGWGLPASEAMACGCALISTSNGGVQDFAIEGETALLSPIKSPKALAENILILLNDSKKRIGMAKKGNESIKTFTFERSGKLFEKCLMQK